jgi:hypothetical protein
MVTPEAGPAERRVIRWVFSALFVVAVAYLAWAWLSRERECEASCKLTGASGGGLVLSGRNRLELSSRCECDVAVPGD